MGAAATRHRQRPARLTPAAARCGSRRHEATRGVTGRHKATPRVTRRHAATRSVPQASCCLQTQTLTYSRKFDSILHTDATSNDHSRHRPLPAAATDRYRNLFMEHTLTSQTLYTCTCVVGMCVYVVPHTGTVGKPSAWRWQLTIRYV